jgi:serine/threonine-protein kinase
MTSGASGEREPNEGLEGIPKPGDVVAGKYVVEAVLGVGGMGVVVSARHAQLGQKVAIKFMRKVAAKSPEAVPRFLREARAVVALQSAHVVRVTDVGVLDDGLPYMVMEHLVGTDLARLLDERKVLPVSDAVDFLLQGMEAIAEAHAMGIVHRDLKPANLFLARTPDGSPLVKVLDFGISKASGVSREQSLTQTSAIVGTPHYMSPEQLRSSKNVDARTDVWALGVILYELVAGRMPFEADSVAGLCAKIAADPPTPLREIDPTMPAALEAVVQRCLEKDVKRRLATVAELASVLQPFASPMGKMAVDRIVRIGGGASGSSVSGDSFPVHAGGASTPVSGQTDTAWQPTGLAPRRRIMAPIGIGVGVLLGLGAAAIFLRPKPADAPKAAAVISAPAASVSAAASAEPAPTATTADVASAAPSATSAASSAPSASAAAKTPPPATKRAPKPAANKGQDVDLLLDRK